MNALIFLLFANIPIIFLIFQEKESIQNLDPWKTNIAIIFIICVDYKMLPRDTQNFSGKAGPHQGVYEGYFLFFVTTLVRNFLGGQPILFIT